MEHQKLTLRGCLGLIVFTLSLLLGFWLVVKFDMCSFRVTGEGTGLENRSIMDGNRVSEMTVTSVFNLTTHHKKGRRLG